MKHRMNRAEAVAFLRELGFPICVRQIEKLAEIGDGPPFRRWGRYVLYDRDELREWAEGRLSGPTNASWT